MRYVIFCLLTWLSNMWQSWLLSLLWVTFLTCLIGTHIFLISSYETWKFITVLFLWKKNSEKEWVYGSFYFHSYSQSYPLLLPIAWPTLLQALCMVNLSICVYGSIFFHEMWERLKITAGVWCIFVFTEPGTVSAHSRCSKMVLGEHQSGHSLCRRMEKYHTDVCLCKCKEKSNLHYLL